MAKKKSSQSGSKKQSSSNPPDLILGDPRANEKTMQNLHRILEQQNFASIDDANQFLQQLMNSTGGNIPEMPARSPLEEAQDLMYKAWQSSKRSARIKLARQALKVSPDCADAYVLLAEETAKTLVEARALYEQGVKAGERALGPELFEEEAGNFWGIFETRPYMRARQGLAQVLLALGELREAAGHMREMLRLNPHDNQGIRYFFTTVLLQMGDDAGLEKLLKQYPGDWSANWKYTTALLAFRKGGINKKADKLLKAAIKHNPFVPPYLLGKKRLPMFMPEYYSPGDESEAIDYVVDATIPWQQTPGACDWLAEIFAQSKT